MFKGKKILAIIPARSGSKGLPEKNIRSMCGKPLIAWSILQGKKSKYIDNVLVTTDSKKIADISKQYGAEVPFIRPKSLANDDSSTFDVLLHAIQFLTKNDRIYDYIVLLEPTSPLRDLSDIDGAIELLINSEFAKSIVGVTKAESSHPSFLFTIQNRLLNPMLKQQPNRLRRQDLKNDYYYLEGSVYVTSIQALIKYGGFYHAETMPWVVERYKAVEVDELSDFIVAEALMNAKFEGILI
jgi:N-acylneuraminate cytidylyltransferase/CMP-N,N'-diacetyllegionaminic acid synthase